MESFISLVVCIGFIFGILGAVYIYSDIHQFHYYYIEDINQLNNVFECREIMKGQGKYVEFGCNIKKNDLAEIVSIPMYVKRYGNYMIRATEHEWLNGYAYKVVSIAFIGCKNLKIVKLPCSINKIRCYAFSGCSSLKKVEIPSSVRIIDEYAFQNCTKLETINIPSNVRYIGEAFCNCNNLTNVVFENINGWEVNNTSIPADDLSNPSIAAKYLRSTYVNSIWKNIYL